MKIKIVLVFFLTFLFTLLSHKPILAIYNPLTVKNNFYGIHIADPVDLEDAAKLVNSEGGDWGYVTFVIRKDQRDVKYWQKVFDQARKLHLIPIVRIATRFENEVWEKPNFDEIDGWVSFFDSLNWVIKNRYLIIGNEPNHAKEWGGEINPQEYAKYLKVFSGELKKASEDFFILNAGLDASAPNSKETMSEELFIQKMLEYDPSVFEAIDGLNSHSYPNPNFSGNENASGRRTIKTFEWEIVLLKSLGVKKELPIFITETGWAHQTDSQKKYTAVNKVGPKLKFTFENVWNNQNIVAITPFILGYNQSPFDIFSWKDNEGKFYDFYYEIQKLSKIKGEPIQENKAKILAIVARPITYGKSDFQGLILIENLGQSILDKNNLSLKSTDGAVEITNLEINSIEPFQTGKGTFEGKSNSSIGYLMPSVHLETAGQQISNSVYFPLMIFPSLKMTFQSIFAKISPLGL